MDDIYVVVDTVKSLPAIREIYRGEGGKLKAEDDVKKNGGFYFVGKASTSTTKPSPPSKPKAS